MGRPYSAAGQAAPAWTKHHRPANTTGRDAAGGWTGLCRPTRRSQTLQPLPLPAASTPDTPLSDETPPNCSCYSIRTRRRRMEAIQRRRTTNRCCCWKRSDPTLRIILTARMTSWLPNLTDRIDQSLLNLQLFIFSISFRVDQRK